MNKLDRVKKIVIATKNEGKLREMREAFQDVAEIVPLKDFGDLPDAAEDGETFAENALIKAEFYRKKTGEACLADDSGLEIAVLGNAPGVHSARFAGFHADDVANNEKMLAELKKIGATKSPAAYKCVLAFADTDGSVLTTEGICEGEIRTVAKGNGGFGYDPYFYVGEKTLAELSLAEKDLISHRGKALRLMTEKLKEKFG